MKINGTATCGCNHCEFKGDSDRVRLPNIEAVRTHLGRDPKTEEWWALRRCGAHQVVRPGRFWVTLSAIEEYRPFVDEDNNDTSQDPLTTAPKNDDSTPKPVATVKASGAMRVKHDKPKKTEAAVRRENRRNTRLARKADRAMLVKQMQASAC